VGWGQARDEHRLACDGWRDREPGDEGRHAEGGQVIQEPVRRERQRHRADYQHELALDAQARAQAAEQGAPHCAAERIE